MEFKLRLENRNRKSILYWINLNKDGKRIKDNQRQVEVCKSK